MKGIKLFYWTQIRSRVCHFLICWELDKMRKKQKDRTWTVEQRHEIETWINELVEAKNIWKEMMLHPELYKS